MHRQDDERHRWISLAQRFQAIDARDPRQSDIDQVDIRDVLPGPFQNIFHGAVKTGRAALVGGVDERAQSLADAVIIFDYDDGNGPWLQIVQHTSERAQMELSSLLSE